MSLTSQQVAFFRANGYLFPVQAFSAAETAQYRAKIEAYEAESGEDVNKRLKIKAHLAFPWMCAVARHPPIVAAVRALIGPNVLLFGSSMFAKEAHDSRFVSWHQDLRLLRPRTARGNHRLARLLARQFRKRLRQGAARQPSWPGSRA